MIIKRLFVLFLIGVQLTSSSIAFAESWFDDYSSAIVNNPSSFETQERGYYSFGSVSMRQDMDKHQLFTLQAPNMRSGCGGIEGFWGGFSYLNPEYLVQSFQKIMKAAPAFAFKIGLKTMCEQCDNAVSSLQDMANLVNQISMDECGATEALANAGGNWINNQMSRDAQSGSESDEGFFNRVANKVSTTADSTTNWLDQNMMNKLEKFYATQYCGGASDGVWGKCEKTLSLVYQRDTFWSKVGTMEADKGNTIFKGCSDDPNCDMIVFLRGMFGDIYFAPAENSNKDEIKNLGTAVYFAPEYVNKSTKQSFMQMLSTDSSATLTFKGMTLLEGGDSIFNPKDLQIDLLNFGKNAQVNMDRVVEAIAQGDFDGVNKGEVTTWINQQALPMWTYINTLSLRKGFTSNCPEKETLSQVAAVSQAYWFLDTIVSAAYDLEHQYSSLLSNAAEVEPVPETAWNTSTDSLNRKIKSVEGQLYQAYADSMRELRANFAAMLDQNMIYNQLASDLSKGFATARNK